MKKMNSAIVSVKNLGYELKNQMYTLLHEYYNNVIWCRFQRDLSEKHQVILLFESETDELRGFSTLKSFNITKDAKAMRIIFSGDTIIHPDFWGSRDLMREFCVYLNNEMSTGMLCYWFLISKGYKTYKYLPLFFHNFYPCYDKDTPRFEHKIMAQLALDKFGKYYDEQKGVVNFNGTRECLKKGVADPREAHLNNPHVKFFIDKNPGYVQGDELVCLAKLTDANLKKIFFRFV